MNLPEAIDPREIRITVVYDNHAGPAPLRAEWGFACLIEYREERILFDAGGDAEILRANLSALNLAPEGVRDLFLSHIHWDHVSGREIFRRNVPGVRVYLLKAFPQELKQSFAGWASEVVEVKGPVPVGGIALSTGPMGLRIREQALLIPTTEGTIAITGCAHPGPLSVLKRARKLLGRDAYLLIGGFHMMDLGEAKRRKAVQEMNTFPLTLVAPGHCTGDAARACFEEVFHDRCLGCHVGWRFPSVQPK